MATHGGYANSSCRGRQWESGHGTYVCGGANPARQNDDLFSGAKLPTPLSLLLHRYHSLDSSVNLDLG